MNSEERKYLRLVLQYDGSEYSGWQVQPDAVTIQGILEDVLVKIAPDASRLIASGRTDAGVHALEQVVSFSTASDHRPSVFMRALNAQIPRAIRVISAEYCKSSFHPRFDAAGKRYTYIISTGTDIAPFLVRYAWHIPYRLNISRIRKASTYLVGEHDFSSFQASGCSAQTTTREIYSISIKQSRSMRFLPFTIHGTFLVISIEADAFLRHMVRNIIGTLVEIGRGELLPEDIVQILFLRDRSVAGPTAPAAGLFLEKVFYDDTTM